MKAVIVFDGELYPGKTESVLSSLRSSLEKRHYDTDEIMVNRNDLAYCMGCFGCWVKKPGMCVISDKIAEINRRTMTADAVFYICPIVFGQFSANMKNVFDRWLPNVLPFFETRPDGSTMHPRRYETYPRHVIVGYADDLTDDDAQLFADITLKHRRNFDVLIYNDDPGKLQENIEGISLQRGDLL